MTIAVILHVIGTVLGVGAVTVNDVMLLRALGDGDQGIAYQKNAIWFSLIIWIGWIILAGSAVYFALTNSWVMQSGKILLKLFLFGVLTINGLMMNFILTPALERLKRVDWQEKRPALKRIVRLGVFPGALSITSWYATLILGAAGRQTWTVEQMFSIFALALLVAWLGAYFVTNWRLKT
ncbi:hypothetical protein HYW32_04165 [Candidatus Berkelbacteria bacterium]|nr:hypothetical protein [Candidatus Berkelbacteria bacterium]